MSNDSISLNPMHPLAQELNKCIEKASPTVASLLSQKGKEMYYPTKGIIAQSAEAKEHANPAYNATVGIATDSKGPLSFPAIAKYFNTDLISPNDIFNYSPTYGQAKLRKLWQGHIRNVNPNVGNQAISLPVVGGGLTHCLSVTGQMFFDPNDTLILPNQIWGNYRLFYNSFHGVTIKQFDFLDNKGFNLDSFKTMLREEAKLHKKIKIILNFPNNPTGYTPTKNEAVAITKEFIDLANQGTKILVILDEAYYGLFFGDEVQQESLFGKLCNAHENIVTVKICGATKEFFVWGFRIGFITIGTKGKGGIDSEDSSFDLYQALEKKLGGIVRATVSNCSSVAQNVLAKVLEDKSYLQDFEKNFTLLQERANRIKTILDDGRYQDVFTPYPFNSGYFMLVKLTNGVESEKLRKTLLEKEKIGTISTAKHDLRIAFSCLEIKDIDHVFQKIYETAKSMQ